MYLFSPVKALVFFSVIGRAIVYPKANEKRFTEGGRIGDGQDTWPHYY